LPFSLNEHENKHENEHENKHENENDVEPNASNNNGNMIDSLSRRRLLFSMLATAGATSSIMSNPAMASDQPLVNDNTAVETEPSLSIATSLRGDGNNRLIIPPKDNRKYETMTLDNGLRVLLCSDPSSNTAAAAMDVHVGATSDPEAVKGMAHFCEVSKRNYYHVISFDLIRVYRQMILI
jgi:hypothetical protein